jgi:hypothetical protein
MIKYVFYVSIRFLLNTFKIHSKCTVRIRYANVCKTLASRQRKLFGSAHFAKDLVMFDSQIVVYLANNVMFYLYTKCVDVCVALRYRTCFG